MLRIIFSMISDMLSDKRHIDNHLFVFKGKKRLSLQWNQYQNFTSDQLPTQRLQWRLTEHHGSPDSKWKPKM